jgi:hypothetical protein
VLRGKFGKRNVYHFSRWHIQCTINKLLIAQLVEAFDNQPASAYWVRASCAEANENGITFVLGRFRLHQFFKQVEKL